MEDYKKRKKKDKKPVYLLIGFLALFAVFIYFITRPSGEKKAIDQVQACSNVADVKSVYERYKFDLLESDEDGKKIVAADFQNAVRNRLSSFNLSEEEVKKCLEWLPPAKTSLNVIVVPDLSRRIIDTLNNPNQIDNDIFILHSIWSSFVEYSKLKHDTKDHLMVDITDADQAKGQFSAVANELQFDLSAHQGKSNRLYFTDDKTKQFDAAVREMYQSAKQKPLGADYVLYFRRYLATHLKKPTLFDNYLNKVIIITDGYLEAENRPSDTKLTPQLYKSVAIGNTREMISNLQLNIPKAPVDLSYTDVLVCEVNERKSGKGKDFEILRAYWMDWLERMKAHKMAFLSREQANDLTKQKIESFFKE